MGKAKKKRQNHRFNPLARPSGGTSDSGAEVQPKALSAHQQRHLERKRLQAEKQQLKQQRRKLSKADRLQHRSESKAIAKSIKSVKQAAAALQARLPPPAEQQPEAPSAEAGKGFRFDLPVAPMESSWGELPEAR